MLFLFKTKSIIITVFLVMISSFLSAQKYFNVSVVLDTSIDKKNLSVGYNDGLNFYPYVVTGDTLNISGHLYAKYLELGFSQSYSGIASMEMFFVDSGNSKIFLYQDKDGRLDDSDLIGAKNVYDTSNKLVLEIRNLKEVKNWGNFIGQNGSRLYKNDSITKEFRRLTKEKNAVMMPLLQANSDNYFSFRSFKIDVANLATYLFAYDTSYLKEIRSFYISVFVPQFGKSIDSAEGEELLRLLTNATTPQKINYAAPQFTTKDVTESPISLTAFQGKFVLLDFWATWCGPCIDEFPNIKTLFYKYNNKNLVIIGISLDYYRDAFIKYIRNNKDKLGWHQIFDEEKKISNLYGIGPVPTLILIDPNGKIIYRNEGKDDAANQQIENFLNE